MLDALQFRITGDNKLVVSTPMVLCPARIPIPDEVLLDFGKCPAPTPDDILAAFKRADLFRIRDEYSAYGWQDPGGEHFSG